MPENAGIILVFHGLRQNGARQQSRQDNTGDGLAHAFDPAQLIKKLRKAGCVLGANFQEQTFLTGYRVDFLDFFEAMQGLA